MTNPSVQSKLPPTERRGRARRRLLVTGKIVQPGGFTADCAIREISEWGGRVQLPHGQHVTDHFQLLEIRTGFAYDAEVVWRGGAMVGLRFTGRRDVRDPASKDHLAQLWRACAPR